MKNINEGTNVTTKGTPSLNMITPITPSSSPSDISTAQTINPFQLFNNPEFGDLRCIEKDGEPWFVGKDAAAALGYADTAKAIRAHVDAEDKQIIKVDEMATLDVKSNFGMTIINESGLYSLIFGSKLEKAKRFKHWVTSEVLPALRKLEVTLLARVKTDRANQCQENIFSPRHFLSHRKLSKKTPGRS